MNKKYISPEIEIVYLLNEDIVATSGDGHDERIECLPEGGCSSEVVG